MRWCWWLDRWGRFAASRDLLTLRRDRGRFRNRQLRWNRGSRFGWIDGFDGWILGELRLFFYKGLPGLLRQRRQWIVRRCAGWPLTNRLLFAAHNWSRRAAWCPCVRLLFMANSGRFFLCGFGMYLTADFRCFRLFTNRRNFFLRSTIRKPDFWVLCMKMSPAQTFFCARISLLVEHKCRLCSCGVDVGMLCGCFGFGRVRGAFSADGTVTVGTAVVLLRYDQLSWRGRFCGLLDRGASGLLLRVRCQFALRMCRFWPGTCASVRCRGDSGAWRGWSDCFGCISAEESADSLRAGCWIARRGSWTASWTISRTVVSTCSVAVRSALSERSGCFALSLNSFTNFCTIWRWTVDVT